MTCDVTVVDGEPGFCPEMLAKPPPSSPFTFTCMPKPITSYPDEQLTDIGRLLKSAALDMEEHMKKLLYAAVGGIEES